MVYSPSQYVRNCSGGDLLYKCHITCKLKINLGKAILHQWHVHVYKCTTISMCVFAIMND